MKNSIKRMVALVLTATLLLSFTGAFAASADVAINSTNFPDSAFRKCVKEAFDKNGNGKLSASEIAAAKKLEIYLSIDYCDIRNMKGIEKLTALERLILDGLYYDVDDFDKPSALKSLDVSKNKKLKELLVYDTKLAKLDVSKNSNLKVLSIERAKISKLDLSKNAKLESVIIGYCDKLTSLDLRKNTKLTIIQITENKNLKTLKLGKYKKLVNFSCADSQLTKLDLSAYTTLKYVSVSNNKKLKTLKLGKLKKLVLLDCMDDKSLTKLDIGGCTKILKRVTTDRAEKLEGIKDYGWGNNDEGYFIIIPVSTKLYNGTKALKIKK